MGKALSRLLKHEICMAAGPLQCSAGTESGIDAAIHSVRQSFEDSEGCLLYTSDAADD